MAEFRELKRFLKAYFRYRSRPTAENHRKLEQLRFQGASCCPTCNEELELARFRRVERGGRLREWITCAGCGEVFELTDLSVQ